jgi:hypothetical protein
MKFPESKQNLTEIFNRAARASMSQDGPPPPSRGGTNRAPFPSPHMSLEMGGSTGHAVKHKHLSLAFAKSHSSHGKKPALPQSKETLTQIFTRAVRTDLAKQGKHITLAPSKANTLRDKFNGLTP